MSKDRVGNTNSTFKVLGASSHADHDRETNDYYATEPKAVRLLLELESFNHNIREPACGEGHLSKEMIRLGYDVYSSDLIDRGYGAVQDFFTTEFAKERDIITNPPYKFAQEFIEHAMENIYYGGKVAMFLKIQFLEGKRRKEMFRKYPPKVIYVSSSRINCMLNGLPIKNSSAVCYARYIREKGYTGDTLIKRFN